MSVFTQHDVDELYRRADFADYELSKVRNTVFTEDIKYFTDQAAWFRDLAKRIDRLIEPSDPDQS